MVPVCEEMKQSIYILRNNGQRTLNLDVVYDLLVIIVFHHLKKRAMLQVCLFTKGCQLHLFSGSMFSVYREQIWIFYMVFGRYTLIACSYSHLNNLFSWLGNTNSAGQRFYNNTICHGQHCCNSGTWPGNTLSFPDAQCCTIFIFRG